MSQKLSVHIEVIIDDAERSDYDGITDAIPMLILGYCSTKRNFGKTGISVTVEDAITSGTESEFTLRED